MRVGKSNRILPSFGIVLGLGLLLAGCGGGPEPQGNGQTNVQTNGQEEPENADQARFRTLVEEGESLLNDYRLNEAKTTFEEALQIKDDASVRDQLAVIDQRMADIQNQPAHEWFNQGVDAERPGMRIEMISRALERDPELVEHIEPEEEGGEAEERNRAADAHRVRSAAYLERGQPERAEVDAAQAIALDPVDARAYYNRGLARLEMEMPDKAAEDFRAAIDIDPEYTEAYEALGLALFRDGRHAEAADAFRQAIDHAAEPRPALYHNHGLALFMADRTEEALASFDRALEGDPSNAIALYNRGIIHYRNERNIEAMSDLQSALDIREDWADAYLVLALVYRATGDEEQERAALEDFLARAEEGEQAEWARRELERIEAGQPIADEDGAEGENGDAQDEAANGGDESAPPENGGDESAPPENGGDESAPPENGGEMNGGN